jgi:similar to stage IV sporulation protein
MIRVEGLSLEKFLNIAAQSGITVYDVQRVSYTVLRAVLSAHGYRRMRRVVPEKYSVTVEKKAGVPFGFKRLSGRKVLLIGLACVVVAVFAASFFVWDVRVTGIETREAIALAKEMQSHGLFVGAFKGGVDIKEIETRLMLDHDEFAWVNLRFKGVVAEIEVVPAEPVPEMVDDTRPCNIVATKDALVESVMALKGRAAVAKGQTVREGDVLISGFIWDEGLTRLLVAARGEVIGSVWYKAEASASMYIEARVPTGRTQTQRVIAIGADTAAVDAPCEFAEFDTRVVGEYDVVGLFLPVKVVTLEHSEVMLKQEQADMKKLMVDLEERAFNDAQGLVPDEAEVVGHETVSEEKDGELVVTVYVQTRENIGKVVYLEE